MWNWRLWVAKKLPWLSQFLNHQGFQNSTFPSPKAGVGKVKAVRLWTSSLDLHWVLWVLLGDRMRPSGVTAGLSYASLREGIPALQSMASFSSCSYLTLVTGREWCSRPWCHVLRTTLTSCLWQFLPYLSLSPIVGGSHFYTVNKEQAVDRPRGGFYFYFWDVLCFRGEVDHCDEHILPLPDLLSQFLGLE